MNSIIQNILVFLAFLGSVTFLVKKFIWKPKKTAKACGKNDCGCH